jgi:serine/threonine protein kinase
MTDYLSFEDDPLAIVLRHRAEHAGRLATFVTSDGRSIDPGLRFAQEDPRIGGFSAVFRMHRNDGRPDQALKIAHRSDAIGPRLLQEAEGARLQAVLADETGVVPTVELIGAVDGVPAVILDWIEGSSLADLLDRAAEAPDRPARIATLIRAVCQSLLDCQEAIEDHAGQFAARRFVHGDLHPGNIIVTERPAGSSRPARIKAWLVDFSESAIGRPRGPLGITKGYASPELARRLDNPDEEIGAASDQFAVGRMLEQALPDTPSSKHSPEAALVRVAARMTRTRPEDRFADWRECIKALDAARGSSLLSRCAEAFRELLRR